MEKTIPVPVPFVNTLVQYLAARPWLEVNDLLVNLRNLLVQSQGQADADPAVPTPVPPAPKGRRKTP